MKNLKNKKGFSLVELMVVVAIMGVLAAIAIPAYNEYRKSAKKTAYRSDMLSLHKGVLAFGVELDSFCERDTTPEDFNIENVGMASLASSKLYGTNANYCTGTNTGGTRCTTQTTCTTLPRDATNCGASWIPAGNGPGKANFIGFENVHTGCSNISSTNEVEHRLRDPSQNNAMPAGCDLATSTYSLGVAGHISGTNYIGFDVDENGVVDETAEGAYGTGSGEVLNTTNGVCT